jgi:hypothetical protein
MKMNRKKEAVFWLALILALISILLLAHPLPTQAGRGLPPRKPPPAAQPPDDDNDKDPTPDGAHIVLQVPSAPAGVWTIVQWQDTAGGWHDIEGWSGSLDEGNQKTWWLGPNLLGKGPFRWLVYQGERGKLLATSDSFYLPDTAGKKVRVEMSFSE